MGPGKAREGGGGYIWASCSYFYECLAGRQAKSWYPASQILTDAAEGTLPAVSFVTPTSLISQHNGFSMAQGDNWIGSIVAAIQDNPTLWSSTAIFITYDDCGCFYDRASPPPLRIGAADLEPLSMHAHFVGGLWRGGGLTARRYGVTRIRIGCGVGTTWGRWYSTAS